MIKVGITHGDINGIGYEIILKTFGDGRMTEVCVPVIYGSSKVAGYHRKALDLPVVPFNQINQAQDAVEEKINLINCAGEDARVELGESTEVAGAAAFQALERACEDLRNGVIDVLVTAPINKHTIQREDFHFPGHTEYLEQKFANEGEKSLMIMATDRLRVALVTGHIALADVPAQLTQKRIIDTAKRFIQSLRRDYRVENPRIAVLSLNPHAGESGLIGSEEQTIINPAIKEMQDKGMLCFGPYAADGFFGSADFTKFDGVLAMYHDQGLIPFKSMSMAEGVNFTAGLPIVRTSPAHGTAYSIAGKNEAQEDSFRQAIYMAIDVFQNRREYDKAFENPLRKLYVEKGSDNEELDLTKEE